MQQHILAWSLGMLSALAAAGVEGQGRVLTVDDFEDGDRRAASGLSWISIADDLLGGASNADLQVTPGDPGAPRVLRVSGEIAPDGWAGAWVALDGRARATDVSDFSGIRLRVRGPGTLQVALRGGPRAGANYAAPIEVRSDWTSVDVPFETLEAQRPESPAFDPRSVRWLGVGVRAPRSGRYAFELDEVGLYAARGDARSASRTDPRWPCASTPRSPPRCRTARGRSWPRRPATTASRGGSRMPPPSRSARTDRPTARGSASRWPDPCRRGGWA